MAREVAIELLGRMILFSENATEGVRQFLRNAAEGVL
jgi:hypothetical protein